LIPIKQAYLANISIFYTVPAVGMKEFMNRLFFYTVLYSVLIGAMALSVSFAYDISPEVQVSDAPIVDFEFDWARDGVYCPTCNSGDGNNRIVFTDRDYNTAIPGPKRNFS